MEGTPADAMILAFHTLLQEKPDLVISGINRGANMGENVYYSGTVGAAREAAINRVPAIAVSQSYRTKEVDFEPAAEFTRKLAPVILKEGLPPGVFLNVNFPQPWGGKGVLHASVFKNHAQSIATRHRSARPQILLASRTAPCRRHRARHGYRSASRRRCFDHAASSGPHARAVAESSFPLGQTARRNRQALSGS